MPALKNQMMEDFAQALAARVKPSDAYAAGHPNATRKTCQEAGCRLAKSVKIVARLSELEALAQKVAEHEQTKVAKKAAEKLMGVLLSMTDRRRIMGHIALHTKDEDTRMRAVMNDAKLAGELIDKTDLVTDGQPLPAAMPQIIVTAPPSFMTRRGSSQN